MVYFRVANYITVLRYKLGNFSPWMADSGFKRLDMRQSFVGKRKKQKLSKKILFGTNKY